MRQSELDKELKRIWDAIHSIQDLLTSSKADNTKPIVAKVGGDKKVPSINEIDKQFKEIEEKFKNPQEKYKQSVTSKRLPKTKGSVVTTESGEGKSPVDKTQKKNE